MHSNMFVRLMSPAGDGTDTPSHQGGGRPGVGEIGDDPNDTVTEAPADDAIDPATDGDEGDANDELDEDADELDADEDDDDPEPKGKARQRATNDAARIEAIARGVASGMSARQPAPVEKPLTDVEIKKLLNAYDVDNETIKDLLNLDKDDEVSPRQLKAAQRMVAGIIKNATTVANVTAGAQFKQFEQRLSGYDKFISAQTQKQAHERFFQRYDYLKPYEKIVSAVATNLADSDPNWGNTSFEDGAKTVAREVRRILADSGIKVSRPKPEAGANHSAEPVVRVNGVPTMQRLAGSGRSSTSGRSGKPANDDEGVYGPGNSGW